MSGQLETVKSFVVGIGGITSEVISPNLVILPTNSSRRLSYIPNLGNSPMTDVEVQEHVDNCPRCYYLTFVRMEFMDILMSINDQHAKFTYGMPFDFTSATVHAMRGRCDDCAPLAYRHGISHEEFTQRVNEFHAATDEFPFVFDDELDYLYLPCGISGCNAHATYAITAWEVRQPTITDLHTSFQCKSHMCEYVSNDTVSYPNIRMTVVEMNQA